MLYSNNKTLGFWTSYEKNQIVRAASVSFLWIWLNLLCWIMNCIKRIGLSGYGHLTVQPELEQCVIFLTYKLGARLGYSFGTYPTWIN